MTEQKTLSARAWVLLGLLSLIWGASFLSIRIVLDELPPLTVVAHRVGWAALALWLLVLGQGRALPRDPGVWWAFLGMGLLNNVLPFTLMAWGQLHISTGLTAILNAGTAVFGVLLAALFLADERLTVQRMVGVGLGLIGVTIALGLSNLADFDITALGQLAVVAGTVSYACAGVWARKRLSGVDPGVAAAGMLLGAAVVMVPLAWAIEGAPSLILSPATWGGIGYMSIIATALAYLLYYRVLEMAGSGNVLLCTLLIPPVAIVLGAVVRDESLPANAYLGFAVLAAGLLVLNAKPRANGQRRP